MQRFGRYLPFILFAGITLFIFRSYFSKGLVPFPGNLLSGYYAPWSHYRPPDYPNGPAFKPMGFDNLRIYYPLRSLAVGQLKDGRLPLWNPYNFSGNTLLATYQSAVFHPMSFLFFLLPQIDAWSVIVILQPLLTCWFTYLFLRRFLPVRSGIFGAVVFALSGFMIVWWEESFMAGYSALVLPLALFAFEKWREEGSRRWLVLLTGAFVWSILSGWFQMTFYLTAALTAWAVYRSRMRGFIIAAGCFMLSVFLCGIHLVPAFEAYRESARGTTDARFLFDGYLLKPEHLVTFLVPDYFGSPATYTYFGNGFYYERVVWFGIIPLMLALYELVRWKSLARKERFFGIMFLVCLSLGLSLPTTFFLLYQLKLPLLSVIIPSRIFYLSTFAGVVLSAFGMERFLRERRIEDVLITYAIFGTALTVAWYVPVTMVREFTGRMVEAEIMTRSLMIPTVSFGIGLFSMWLYANLKRFTPLLYGILLLVTVAGSLVFANKYLYFSERRFIYPETPVMEKIREMAGFNRFWSFGRGYTIENNFATMHRLQSPEGYDSFYIRRYGELLHAAANGGQYSAEIPRADALIPQAEHIGSVPENHYRWRLLNLLGVKYIAGATSPLPEFAAADPDPALLQPVWRDREYSIWENREALPRAYLVGEVRNITGDQKILDFLFDPNTDLRKQAVLEGYGGMGSGSGGTAEITRFEPNDVTVSTVATQGSILILSDAYYPGWRAEVDGKPTKLYRANYAFRGVEVPAGTHTVTFLYRPVAWTIGLALSGTGILLSGVTLYLYSRRRRDPRSRYV
ncbi:hypothetical protein A2Z33_03660 [Candidatus Gottesmanbacteria bacterium RBG_16_52_11]|uniref:Membrane protein 6-pyruvoyl-tetrahydropterin synthase-related domain-containing protein n=1 Tax=Candidatus Gottesmanbacteria bacterium RBG_16_52_11 TaxID=1798374 RepID=A0A1F5YVI1_9BACT|nr:MAG: hypothetical protein A2Z33_03660 [Candidatus Gottesmanbacteria bacterium RBG_16_52_11]